MCMPYCDWLLIQKISSSNPLICWSYRWHVNLLTVNTKRQGRRKFWKSGWACSTVIGIICPPGWNRVNWFAKIWVCHGTPGTPGTTGLVYDCLLASMKLEATKCLDFVKINMFNFQNHFDTKLILLKIQECPDGLKTRFTVKP